MIQKNLYTYLSKNSLVNEHIDLYIKPAFITKSLKYFNASLRIRFKRYSIHSDLINKIIFRYSMSPTPIEIRRNLYDILNEVE